MPLKIIENDLYKMPLDAIVIPTYELKFAEYYDRFIEKETKVLYQYNGDPTFLTYAGILHSESHSPYNHLMMVVGPHFYKGRVPRNIRLLKESYENCLNLAKKLNIRSIGFPLISSGGKKFPKKIAFQVAKQTIEHFLKENDLEVYIVVFDKESILYAEEYIEPLDSYLEGHFRKTFKKSLSFPDKPLKMFHEVLIDLLNSYRIDPVKMYKKAFISKAHFHKLISGKGAPSRKTALLLTVAMELSLEDAIHLLASAGYTFNTSSHFDLIIEYHLKKKRYDLNELDQTLYQYTNETLKKYE
jgi:O-acetyl-ADP-ribose deacetylase (regulator of RNase III)